MSYESNDIDLSEMRQVRDGQNVLLASYSNYYLTSLEQSWMRLVGKRA